jgi:VCBS repeat-containing protein
VGGGSNNLMAATGEVLVETPDGPDLTAEQQAQLWAQAEPLLAQLKQSTEEESAMFIPDIGPATGLLLGAAVAVGATPAQAADNYVLGRCKVSSPDSGAEILPTFHGDDYLYKYHSGDLRYQGFSFDRGDSKITLVKAPMHGRVEHDNSTKSNNWYHYYSTEGYSGQDRFVMQVEKDGVKVQIQYLIEVPAEGESADYLCSPDIWKISATTPALDNASLQALLGAANINGNVSATFADLPGAAVGQTVGSNITFDTNAAGNNWFIDSTPADNSEFLPTSNPYEWVAKEGSAAYGKMDMLSVLLHEYGHVLGIDHSANSHDYMATTLTAGVRRMPSADELALMQQLVEQVKVGLTESTLSPTLPLQGGGDAPGFPTLPLGANFIGFLGLLRSSRYGGVSISPDASTLVTKYAVAANATLTNGSLNVSDGWSAQGSVDIGNGMAVMNEVSASQTRLSQVFMVNDRDRFLSFTLAGTALDNLTGAPDDAFEVALLEANTGASLLGGTGLTRSDAFLNLQADGTQNAANCVTCINNADGSRTYRVDLAGIAAGTAVNLSFDLIGFGGNGSHVTVSDVRLSGLPQLHDEAATLLEDGSLAFNPFAQVDNAALLQLGSHVVDQPAHGAVTVNADGTFSYTPTADYFGTDTFTYRLSDGPLESNLATVSLTITPVNDAPVVADVLATTAEDTALVIALGAYATDVDSTALTTQIVTGPAHGVLTQNADGSYTYTPDANYNGADSFTYLANDGALDSNIATVSLNVTAVNDAPTLGDLNLAAVEDTALATA